jgi:hypothetical protein
VPERPEKVDQTASSGASGRSDQGSQIRGDNGTKDRRLIAYTQHLTITLEVLPDNVSLLQIKKWPVW